jgi:hypothetical protein
MGPSSQINRNSFFYGHWKNGAKELRAFLISKLFCKSLIFNFRYLTVPLLAESRSCKYGGVKIEIKKFGNMKVFQIIRLR